MHTYPALKNEFYAQVSTAASISASSKIITGLLP